ncbi:MULTISPECIES: MarR family winged helix-turn-helix transcriptional regulator [Rhodomicrobium]|uniref:MarR family winged helix-turn-helix transcriptional regulator n=1 Tax=Rhodomicrobium TaxID=1068 RepID=UPI000B4BB109|nr:MULTISPECIES: MarR family winged helix-turn-helix transcriptional regulator [Rhodomicrobium]
MSEDAEFLAPRDSTCTCLRIRKASRLVSQIYDQFLEPHGLTITQYGLLAHLAWLDGITIGALAERLIMDPTTLTRNLRPLERDGFVTHEADPRDRRARRLKLTESGRERLAKAKPAWLAAQRHVERAIGSDRSPSVNAALDHVLQRLSQ